MNKRVLLLCELHHAETELGETYRAVAKRQAADHGTYYPCRTLADQCDQHAEHLRVWAERLGAELHPAQRSEALSTVQDALRRKPLAFRTEAALLLLDDLCELYVQAESVNIHWVMLGQLAQALRDPDMVTEVSTLHGENLNQAKWLKTRIKEVTPQALLATD
ncbi:hypothetical protein AB0952_24775 [Streptomyces caniferus]|uniref:hypothetical protein n=1 Tax=Streptomyces caniferus TaxID=285557 RepID=UPI003451234C